MPRYVAILKLLLDEDSITEATQNAEGEAIRICDNSFTDCCKVVAVVEEADAGDFDLDPEDVWPTGR